ncbi:hypothetical protein HY469_00810 [Candidatus Roizmanbacteria bacterium]|nr:hypothetical protein [Candidatus Roizmanbacteria bacterium]
MASHTKSRIFSLDLIRGFFILLMVIAHSIFFFHTGTNTILSAINQFADLVSFSGLLFISGAAAYSAYIHYRHPDQSVRVRVFKRIAWYLTGYYVLAIVGIGFDNLSLQSVSEILLFRTLVPFTEFLIPFLLLGLLNLPLRSFYRLVSSSIIYTSIAAVMVYMVGSILATFPVPDYMLAIKAIFVGHPGWYSFPILQYSPVYLFGIFIGRQIYEHEDVGFVKRILKLLSFLLLIIAFTLAFATEQLTTLLVRFPPNISFIALGTGCSVLLLYLAVKLHELRDMPWTRTVLLLFGQNTFAILVSHTILVFLFAQSGLPQVHSVVLTGILTILSLWLSLYGAKLLPFNYQFGLTVVKWCECEVTQCTHAHEHRLIVLMKYFIVKALAVKDILSVRIGKKRYALVSRWSIILAGGVLLLVATPLGLAENDAYFQQTIGALSGSTNRTWFLTTTHESLTYSITIPEKYLTGQQDVSIQYQVNDEEPKDFPSESSETWKITLPRTLLPVGEHTVKTIITVYETNYETQPTKFYVSEPLLVTWTIDWEGYDVKNVYLEELAAIADKRNLPMTHMFNPRIYFAEDISPERADYLTDWVLERNTINHEEIGLHLHMFPDFVAAAGMTPKTEPVWGGGYTPGYDILTTSYSAEELRQILEYAKATFTEKGLGRPLSYRAGGWFANTETLRALDASGFLVDSSGRTSYQFGSNHLPGPWDLRETSQPYFPSETNQNSPNPPPRFSLLEVPNNGADSFWSTKEAMIDRFDKNYTGGVLTQPKQVTFLSHPHWFNQENKDNKVEEVFSYIDQFTYDHDHGPVIYGTLLDVYEMFSPTLEEE